MAKKNWIQDAVNPKHKGYCTPMTKSTCTPRRKAFAMTMKKHHGFHKKHESGGTLDFLQPMIEKFQNGSILPPADVKNISLNQFRSNGNKNVGNYINISRIIDNPGTAQADTTYLLTNQKNNGQVNDYYINKSGSELHTTFPKGKSVFSNLSPDQIKNVKSTAENYFSNSYFK